MLTKQELAGMPYEDAVVALCTLSEKAGYELSWQEIIAALKLADYPLDGLVSYILRTTREQIAKSET